MPIELRVAEFGVVLVASVHNPSLLNPDFLRVNDVVPEGWDTTGVITTPALAQVSYANGTNVVLTPDRLSVVRPVSAAEVPEYGDGDPSPSQIADRYAYLLPHIPYVAAGVNPTIDITGASAADLAAALTEALLAPGPWRDRGAGPSRSVFELTFEHEEGRANFRIEVVGENEGAGTIRCSANVHRDRPPEAQDLGWLHDWLGRWREHLTFVAEVMHADLVPAIEAHLGHAG